MPRLAIKFTQIYLILISKGKYFLSIRFKNVDKRIYWHRKNIGLLHRHVFYWPLETRKMLLQSRN